MTVASDWDVQVWGNKQSKHCLCMCLHARAHWPCQFISEHKEKDTGGHQHSLAKDTVY